VWAAFIFIGLILTASIFTALILTAAGSLIALGILLAESFQHVRG
jgi:hypothetical protein